MPTPARTQRRRRGAARAGALVVFVAAVLALVPAASASAHDYLVASSPAADSVVTAPIKTVTLTFDDLVLDLSGDGSSAIVEVTGPGGGRHFEAGCPKILGRTVSAPVALGGSGRYTVTWQVVSADGHPVSNSISFTYAAPPGAIPATGSTAGPACGAGSPASGPPGRSTAATTSGGIAPWAVLGVAGVIVLLAIGGVLFILVAARRAPRGSASRSTLPPDDE